MEIKVRFFIYGINSDNEIDIMEVNESEFIATDGNIEYERHTMFQNGVRQITLTKQNY